MGDEDGGGLKEKGGDNEPTEGGANLFWGKKVAPLLATTSDTATVEYEAVFQISMHIS